ncbi:urease accessory protein UreD, partial [Thiohalomonas denitrificans]|uniref:urease accessory protein UreD n=1 Tax=Thiohalomonas denitrificans TaxID=415747 RepID=UPI0026E9682C
MPQQSSGWKARLELGFEPRAGRTVLAKRIQRGPLAVQRPFHPGDGACHVYLLHPPGGVVGGDELSVRAAAAAEAGALITTPGATKFYRSAGPRAYMEQRLNVADGGALEWLPQENIVFPGALADIRTRIDLKGQAGFIGWETLCLGRPAADERFDAG